MCQIMWLNKGKEKGCKSKETTKLNLPESFATVSLCIL